MAKLGVSQPGRVKTLSEQPFPYPQQVTLPSWQLKSSETAIIAGKSPGQRYILQKGDTTATIAAFHQLHTDGNVSRLLVTYTDARPATVYIHPVEHTETGHFGAFVFENQAHITACLNPNAPSTLTEQQFISNKYRHNLHFFAWLAGQKDLTDSSCLWTLISTPIAPDATPDEITQTFKQLETAWVEWYQWWQLH
ncbi:cyanoexosortase A system-associated protein [Synechocystis salina LEGE 06155]|nr:cyanoexosortase A system-associated protein [Synechocystis salina LEGE 06155]